MENNMALILDITDNGIIDHKREYTPLCQDAFNSLRQYFKIPINTLQRRISKSHSNDAKYLIKLSIDNQKRMCLI